MPMLFAAQNHHRQRIMNRRTNLGPDARQITSFAFAFVCRLDFELLHFELNRRLVV